MIKIKGQINLERVDKGEQAEVRSGKGCSYVRGGLSFNCNSYHVHIDISPEAVSSDTLHIHY